jgi:hypothetical protein
MLGDFLIVSNSSLVYDISQNKELGIMTKCISLDCDIGDPGGKVSGGYFNRADVYRNSYSMKY